MFPLRRPEKTSDCTYSLPVLCAVGPGMGLNAGPGIAATRCSYVQNVQPQAAQPHGNPPPGFPPLPGLQPPMQGSPSNAQNVQPPAAQPHPQFGNPQPGHLHPPAAQPYPYIGSPQPGYFPSGFPPNVQNVQPPVEPCKLEYVARLLLEQDKKMTGIHYVWQQPIDLQQMNSVLNPDAEVFRPGHDLTECRLSDLSQTTTFRVELYKHFNHHYGALDRSPASQAKSSQDSRSLINANNIATAILASFGTMGPGLLNVNSQEFQQFLKAGLNDIIELYSAKAFGRSSVLIFYSIKPELFYEDFVAIQAELQKKIHSDSLLHYAEAIQHLRTNEIWDHDSVSKALTIDANSLQRFPMQAVNAFHMTFGQNKGDIVGALCRLSQVVNEQQVQVDKRTS